MYRKNKISEELKNGWKQLLTTEIITQEEKWALRIGDYLAIFD
jgi:hypothetical protein